VPPESYHSAIKWQPTEYTEIPARWNDGVVLLNGQYEEIG
jgi:hypothetical protein